MSDPCHPFSDDLPGETVRDPRTGLCQACQADIAFFRFRDGPEDLQVLEWMDAYQLAACETHRRVFFYADGCQDCAGASAPLP